MANYTNNFVYISQKVIVIDKNSKKVDYRNFIQILLYSFVKSTLNVYESGFK